jgi:phosphoglycolate phosphatase-like HAD superfamily hydrolase
MANALLRETGLAVTSEQAEQLQRCHAESYARQVAQVKPPPGAVDLSASLAIAGIGWAIASRNKQYACSALMLSTTCRRAGSWFAFWRLWLG